MRALPSHAKAQATRRQYAQIIKKVLDYAVFPTRVISASPIPRGWLPKVKDRKAFAHLYPAEDAQLMACERIPLHDRIYYGFLSREGLRAEEAETLRVLDVDLLRGAIRLDANKTNDPRAWVLDADVAAALRVYLERFRDFPTGEDRLFVDEHGRPRSGEKRAERLREHLRTAGVARAELYERNANRLPMRVHDLRATFITVSLANGKNEAWVQDRTGHTTSIMLNRYRRAARTYAELGLGPLHALNEAIPELASHQGVGQRVGHKSPRPLGGMADAGDLKGDPQLREPASSENRTHEGAPKCTKEQGGPGGRPTPEASVGREMNGYRCAAPSPLVERNAIVSDARLDTARSLLSAVENALERNDLKLATAATRALATFVEELARSRGA